MDFLGRSEPGNPVVKKPRIVYGLGTDQPLQTGIPALGRWSLLAAVCLTLSGRLQAESPVKKGHEFFVVKTPDGREEMRISCDETPAGENACVIRATEFVVPDLKTGTQFSTWARLLSAGNDSLRNSLCGGLQLIEPNVKESKEIVDLLRTACANGETRRLGKAYAKMDSLSKATCIVINREEYLKFKRGAGGTWVYQADKPGPCLDSKRYVISSDSAANRKSFEMIFAYSGSQSVACAEEKNIEKNAVLRQLTDGHIEVPSQCRYVYLQ